MLFVKYTFKEQKLPNFHLILNWQNAKFKVHSRSWCCLRNLKNIQIDEFAKLNSLWVLNLTKLQSYKSALV